MDLLEAGGDRSLSSMVSVADTDEKDSPLAALAILVRSPSRTKEGLDEVPPSRLSSASMDRMVLRLDKEEATEELDRGVKLGAEGARGGVRGCIRGVVSACGLRNPGGR